MYDFYEEPRQLNIKKVVIISIIAAILIISIIVIIAKKLSTPKDATVETTRNFCHFL